LNRVLGRRASTVLITDTDFPDRQARETRSLFVIKGVNNLEHQESRRWRTGRTVPRDRVYAVDQIISPTENASALPLEFGEWMSIAERAPDDATADYLHQVFEPTGRAIGGLEKALAGLGLLEDALALDLRRPQDYFHRMWSTAFRATDLADAATAEENTYDGTEACA
jgi:hypothetical protein